MTRGGWRVWAQDSRWGWGAYGNLGLRAGSADTRHEAEVEAREALAKLERPY